MEDRPRPDVLLESATSRFVHRTVTDQDIKDIALRGQHMRHLRNLYVDDHISSGFERSRTEFFSGQTFQTRATVVKPGISTISTLSDRVRPSRMYDHGFKARFYKALVLHSMAVAASRLGRAASELFASDERNDPFIDNSFDMWSKTSVVIGNRRIVLGLSDKLDCLKIYDFLYLFLLRKLIPHHQLDAWTKLDSKTWPYNRDGWKRDSQRVHEWYNLLLENRRVLVPEDLVDLLCKQA